MRAKIIDLAERWLVDLRSHGVTDEQVAAATGMYASDLLELVCDDVLDGLALLRPGAQRWQVLREIEELGGRASRNS